MKQRFIVLLSMIIAIMMLVSACQTTVVPQPTEEQKPEEPVQEESEEAEVKIEGDLMLYTSATDKFIAAVVEKFNAKYPDVNAQYFRSGTEEVVSKLLAENMTNSIQADLIMVSDSPTYESLKDLDLLLKYDYPNINDIYSEFVDPEHFYYGTYPGSMGIIYNTNLVTEAPTSWKDLLDESIKGNVIMPNPLYSGTAANMLLEMLQVEEFGWSFYEGLKANDVIIVNGNGGVISAVTAGEAAYGIVFDADAYTAKANGSPVDYVYPKEGSPATADPIAILKTTKNLPAAKAFIDYMLSEEIQAFGRDTNGRTPVNKNVPVLEGRVSLSDRKTLISDAKMLFEIRDEMKMKFKDLFGL